MATNKTGLNIGDATFARSIAGRKTLVNQFYADIENLVKILNGDKYAAFKKTIQKNWVGADADDFLADIEKTRGQLQTKLRALKTKFDTAMTSDANQFKKFQSTNVK